MDRDALLDRAADAVRGADALLIGAGAGMGVDSGLPDFRGNEGFWQAYPPYAHLGLSFEELANPRWFDDHPALAWGFYGHRYNLYRDTTPHVGFEILRRWAARMKHGAFVYTSNVDGHFQKAGFEAERVHEVHGSVHWMQCLGGCRELFRSAAAAPGGVAVDEATMRAAEPLPACPACGEMARPNILMFNDQGWDESRAAEEEERLRDWLKQVGRDRLVIVECGAGTAVPTVRLFCLHIYGRHGAPLIRINVREPEVPPGNVGLDLGALAALQAIDERLAR